MTTLIEQRYPTDCMIAAIAMALDLPYEEVYGAAIGCGEYKEDHAEGIRREYEIFKKLGLEEAKYQNGRAIGGDYKCFHRDWAISPEFFVTRFWGRPCILSVPSLNKEGGWHAIYYDGFEVFDPNPPSRNRYAADSFDTLKPNDAATFRPDITSILAMRRAAAIASESSAVSE